MRVWGVICLFLVDFFLFILVVLWLGFVVVFCEVWWRKYKVWGVLWCGFGFGEVFVLLYFFLLIWFCFFFFVDVVDLGLNCVMFNLVFWFLWDFGFVLRLFVFVLKFKSFIFIVFEIFCVFFVVSIWFVVFFKV